MTHHEWQARRARIPEPIRVVAMKDPIVHRLCEEFSAGYIVLWEEALCQMVIHLSKQSEHLTEHVMKHAMTHIPPIVIPKENFK